MTMKMKQNMGTIIRIIIGLLFTAPIWVAVIYSFHPNTDFLSTHLSLWTDNPTFDNYKYVFEEIPIWTYLKNSFIMILICVPCQLILECMAAYAFAFLKFPFKNTIFTIFLATMMIPGEVTIVSNYITVQNLGLMNTYLGMSITSLVGVGGVFMLRQSMLSMPKELWESARMDGCGKIRYFISFMIPLNKSIMTAMALQAFVGVYNAYLWPLLITTKSEYHTIQIAMSKLTGTVSMLYGTMLSAAVMCMLIPAIIFLFGQDKIVQGMTAGAVKS